MKRRKKDWSSASAIGLWWVGAAALAGCSLHLDQIAGELASEDARAPAPAADGSADGAGAAPGLTDASAPPLTSDVITGSPGDEGGATTALDGSTGDAARPPMGDAGCTRDSDCPLDLARCLASSCNAGTCSSLTPYGLLASQFATSGAPPAAHPGRRAQLIAAAYPYLFVVQSTGVQAFDVSHPGDQSPRTVRIEGLPAEPIVTTVAVGTLVYFVSDVTRAVTGAYQALAWIDIPSDVAADGTLHAHSAPSPLFVEPPAAQMPTKIDALYNAQPNPPDGLLLVYASSDHTTYYPTALTNKPQGGTLVPFWNQALVTGADVAVSSGSRLIAYTSDSPQPKFALVTAPGTSAVTVGSQVTVPTASAAQAAFSSNAAGGVLWASAPLTDGAIGSARLSVLLASGAVTSLAAVTRVEATTFVDLERYPVPLAASQVVVAPPVWIAGTKLALGLAADHLNPLSKTAVHVLSVSEGTLTAETGFVSLPAAPATIDMASSNQLAYALAGGATGSTVYVLAAQCRQAN